jgi:hypothetical protein
MREQVRGLREMVEASGYQVNFVGSALGLDSKKVWPDTDPFSRRRLLSAAIRRARLTASSLPSTRGRPSAAHHIPSPARRLSRTLVVRRSRVARLGGARFDAQHVDVDQARLVSVEL